MKYYIGEYDHGSYYLWGDVPALMPPTLRGERKSMPGSWDRARANYTSDHKWDGRKQKSSGWAWFDKALDERRREATAIRNGKDWFGSGGNCSLQRRAASGSTSRKFASAMIAKIPLALSRHIAAVYHPGRRM